MISLSRISLLLPYRVKFLTLHTLFRWGCLYLFAASLLGCAAIRRQFNDECKSHAYISRGLNEFISSRYSSGAPVRLAIIPFSVPANLSTHSPEFPGLDRRLAELVHAHFISRDELPIIEVFNRLDWPGKKEEFYTGNFGAIAAAREAGYDFVMVGSLERISDASTLTAAAKVIEVESGITLYYGKTSVTSYKDSDRNFWAHIGADTRRPDKIFDSQLIEDLSRCVVESVIAGDNR